jgi:myo-inositol-1(or 4)-monophosphatase
VEKVFLERELYRRETRTGNADSRIVGEAPRIVENRVRRDFGELMNLQSSKKSPDFARGTVEYVREKLYEFFVEKRPNYSLRIENYSRDWTGDGEWSIYVDGLSGVSNFLHAIPYFATLLALRRNGETILGVVNGYASGEMFTVSRGNGAFLNGRRIRVSSRVLGENSLVALDWDGHWKPSGEVAEKIGGYRVTGCCPLDFCHVACGRYDASVVSRGSEEELELGKLFIAEAGGLCCSSGDGGVVFGNGSLATDVRKLLPWSEGYGKN